MIAKRVPEEFWDYGLTWVSEISSLTFSSAGSITGGVPIEAVTGDTIDISEYLDFGFYNKVWFKDNAGSSPYEPSRWLGVSQSWKAHVLPCSQCQGTSTFTFHRTAGPCLIHVATIN